MSRHALLLTLILLVAATTALAAEPPARDEATPEGASVTAPEAVPAPPAVPLDALHLQIRSIFEREQEQVVTLRAQMKSAADPQQAIEIQRQIERLKQQTEIDVLKAQADDARRKGRDAQVAEIEAAIRVLEAPPEKRVPMERPAPRDAQDR